MKVFVCLLAVFGLTVADGDVLEFTDDTFKSEIGKHDIILVEFFAPWCGHCKKLAPEYEVAATKLKRADPPVPLAKVDCIENKDTCSEFGVSGYPTLKIFRDGEISSDYQGPRTADGIVSTMKKQSAPVTKELSTVDEINAFIDNFDVGIVGYFTSANNAKSEFAKAASKLFEDYRFAFTISEDALKEFGYSDQVVLYRPKRLKSKFEENEVVFEGDVKSGKLQTFITDNSKGLCGHMTTDNQDQFQKPLLVAYYNVDYEKNQKGTNYWRNRVMKVGKKYAGKTLNYAVANKGEFALALEEYGLADTGSDLPVVVIQGSKGEKFRMEDEFSRDGATLDAFITAFFDGKLEQYLKSEPIPEDDEGPVKVVVAKNFDKVVNDDTKDVLIEFYAPWCGHCKKLTPIYEELASKLANDENIVIAKMDATANDVPQPFEVRGFPTLYWAPMSGKPKKYEGGREIDDFVSYIKREATKKPVDLTSKKTEL
ncbi:protein disulfide-isomerase A3-like [Anneissia japonica]|uniref:protein disulfide-isomerase A3-like n=1 Tax=Anneissia japonica TaxID=1529436 RepID=UPI0014259B6D|nr:protein disulfide-isomerase A3-like [Anneissia japonica]